MSIWAVLEKNQYYPLAKLLIYFGGRNIPGSEVVDLVERVKRRLGCEIVRICLKSCVSQPNRVS